MSTIISVEHLSKQYRIGSLKRSNSFRDIFDDKIRSIFKKKDQNNPITENTIWALRDVSFSVNEGEVLGIVGRNGAGKSTLLKILARITGPTEGRIQIKGRIASLLEVGTGFSGELTGRENIFLNGSILGMRKAEITRKLDEIVTFAEVEKFIDTPVKRYSTGMYMRLAFAVAAHLEPEILIVDEVLAVGDAQFQKKSLGRMKSISKEGRTVLFVSHNLAAVNSLCQKGLLLHSGALHFHGSAKDAVNKYMELQELNVGEKNWQEHEHTIGGEGVRILSARIISEEAVTVNVSISADFFLEVKFSNNNGGRHLSSNFQLFTAGGIGVLSTANWKSAMPNDDPWSGREFPKGVFRATCRIPGLFLNEGSYYVNILILSDAMNIIARIDNAISFTIVDTGEMRKEYTDGWLGVVRPKLEWRMEYLGEESKTA